MQYNVGNYRYDKGNIYKRVWWFIYKHIEKGTFTYMQGVRKVNRLHERR